MAKLVNLQGELIDNKWQSLSDEQAPFAHAIIPFKRFQQEQQTFIEEAQKQPLGIEFEPDDNPKELESWAEYLHLFKCIQIQFPVFTDGRGYSSAALLRERFNYQGELIAVGDVLLDQLFYMQRCGFSHFLLREDQNLSHLEFYLQTFSHNYQADSLNKPTISDYRSEAI